GVFGGQLAIPEGGAAQVKCTVAAPPSYQPAAMGEVVAAPLIVGAVLSMLIPETVVLALLPALSVAVPVDDWPVPSASVASAEELLVPEEVSAELEGTVVTLLFHPPAAGEVVGVPLIVGAVLSMLIPETVALALLPALSVAVPVTL